VCLEDKEHTFVPSHSVSPDCCVEGHRFCSDCWVEFLDHNMKHSSMGRGAPNPTPLACPLCRATILVPDVWASVGVDLPAVWTHGEDKKPTVVQAETLTDCVGVVEPLTWVNSESTRSSTEATDCDASQRTPLCRRVAEMGAFCFRGAIRVANRAVQADVHYVQAALASV